MPTPLTDADKVLRNDTGITIATNIASIATALGTSNALGSLDDVTINTGTLTGNQALVYDAVAGKWVNSNLIVPDELNDLSDVSINTPLNRQELVYNDALEVFQNKTTRVELTMAQYNQLVEDDHVLPNVDYYITDAPSMQGSSKDLSYDGGTDSVHDVVEDVKSDVSGLDTNKADKTQLGGFTITYSDIASGDTVKVTATRGYCIATYNSGDVSCSVYAFSNLANTFRFKSISGSDTRLTATRDSNGVVTITNNGGAYADIIIVYN